MGMINAECTISIDEMPRIHAIAIRGAGGALWEMRVGK